VVRVVLQLPDNQIVIDLGGGPVPSHPAHGQYGGLCW
jgi:hypothetical protein